MKKLGIILLLFPLSLAGRAQSLDSLENYLLTHNPSLQAQAYELEAAEAAIDVAGGLPDPQLSAGLLALPTEPGMGMEQIRVSASQMLPQPGLLRNQVKAAEAKHRATAQALRLQQRQLVRELRLAYYDLYWVQAQKRSIKAQQTNLRELQPVALQAYSAGRSPMSEVLRLQARILELEKMLSQLQAEESKAQAQLNRLLNLPGHHVLKTADTLVARFSRLPQRPDSSWKQHPQLQQWEQQFEAQNFRTRVNERMRLPMPGLGLEYMRMADGMNGWMPMLMLQLPIWQKKYRGMLKESKAMARAIALEAESVQNSLESGWQAAQARWRSAQKEKELLAEQVKLQRSIQAQLQTEFSAGTSSLESLLMEENTFLNLRLALEKVLLSQLQAEAELRFLMGE